MTTATAPPPAPPVEDSPDETLRTFLVADLFCGAGGSSTGAQKAIAAMNGRMDLVAVNHWPTAVKTHSLNHPQARHYVQNLETADPETIVPDGYLDLLMASPECRFFSRARGGKPTQEQGRMSPWIVQRWLTSINVRVLLVENVPEFKHWGPLLPNGKPDPARRGLYFQEWVRSLWGLGYEVDWLELNSADYGDATSRIRFFLQARNDGQPIRWPEATHAKNPEGQLGPPLKKWRGAREIIDWDNAGRSLLDDPKYRRKPLAIKTRRRIARGLIKYGGPLAWLYIRLLDLPEYDDAVILENLNTPFILNRNGENGSVRCHPVSEPAPTATGRGGGYLLQTQAQPFTCANRSGNEPKDTGHPVAPILTPNGGGIFLVSPGADPADAPAPESAPFLIGQQSGAAPRPAGQPAPTIAQKGAISLTQPLIVLYYSQSGCAKPDAPLASITAKGRKHALIQPLIVQYYTHGDCDSAEQPLSTVTTKDRHGLCQPTVLQVNHHDKNGADDRAQPTQAPLPTVTAKRNLALAEPTLVQIDHAHHADGDDRRALSVDNPLTTITGKNNLALAQPLIVQTGQTGGNGSSARPAGQPLPAILTLNDINLAEPAADAFIVPNHGERDGQQPRVHGLHDPAPAVTTKNPGNLVTPEAKAALIHAVEHAEIDPRRVVAINGQVYILDIRFRMLQNPELARAMGFDDEQTQYEFTGTVSEITKQIGNAVPVNLSAALVSSALSTAP